MNAFLKRVLLLFMVLPGYGQAEATGMKSLDYEACRLLVQAGEILSMQELMAVVNSLAEGKLLDTRLLQQDDTYIYEMEVAGSDGMVKMLYVDARSGAQTDPLVAKTP